MVRAHHDPQFLQIFFHSPLLGQCPGLVGFGGAISGAIFGVIADYLLGHGFGYGTLFVLVGTFHLIGFLAIVLFAGKRFNRFVWMTSWR